MVCNPCEHQFFIVFFIFSFIPSSICLSSLSKCCHSSFEKFTYSPMDNNGLGLSSLILTHDNITLCKYVSYEEKGRDKWLFICKTRAHIYLMIKKPYHCILWIEPFDKSLVLMVSRIRMCSVYYFITYDTIRFAHTWISCTPASPYTVSFNFPTHMCELLRLLFKCSLCFSLFPFPISYWIGQFDHNKRLLGVFRKRKLKYTSPLEYSPEKETLLSHLHDR